MITPYKNRIIDKDGLVKVYKNLHRRTWSIKQYGLVVGHAKRLILKRVEFKVNEKGRQKVLKKSRKTYILTLMDFCMMVKQTK